MRVDAEAERVDRDGAGGFDRAEHQVVTLASLVPKCHPLEVLIRELKLVEQGFLCVRWNHFTSLIRLAVDDRKQLAGALKHDNVLVENEEVVVGAALQVEDVLALDPLDACMSTLIPVAVNAVLVVATCVSLPRQDEQCAWIEDLIARLDCDDINILNLKSPSHELALVVLAIEDFRQS